MTDLERAENLLAEQGYTCVLCRGEDVYTSRERGVKPLLSFLDGEKDLRGFSAVDKVVGKATAFLYVLLGVSCVYTPVISEAAVRVLREHGIRVEYGQVVPAIFNHRREGFCPMETATKEIEDPAEALAAIRQTLKILSAK